MFELVFSLYLHGNDESLVTVRISWKPFCAVLSYVPRKEISWILLLNKKEFGLLLHDREISPHKCLKYCVRGDGKIADTAVFFSHHKGEIHRISRRFFCHCLVRMQDHHHHHDVHWGLLSHISPFSNSKNIDRESYGLETLFEKILSKRRKKRNRIPNDSCQKFF